MNDQLRLIAKDEECILSVWFEDNRCRFFIHCARSRECRTMRSWQIVGLFNVKQIKPEVRDGGATCAVFNKFHWCFRFVTAKLVACAVDRLQPDPTKQSAPRISLGQHPVRGGGTDESFSFFSRNIPPITALSLMQRRQTVVALDVCTLQERIVT